MILEQRGGQQRPAPGPAGLGALKLTKTARAPVLMPGAWARTPLIGKMGASRALREAARSAAADSLCLASGGTANTLICPCVGRLSMVAGTARARWLWQPAAASGADVLLSIAADAGRSLGPMLPSSARERWPFFVARDS